MQSYPVTNAIIMAAGLSSRFRPLSETIPKALLPVNGEILIERQIRQLQEAGISSIYIVVGYKAELYEYLTSKFSVELIYNPDYATRNNNASIYVARDVISSSYICCGDHYFAKNPFLAQETRAYYAACYAQGPTDEYCMFTDPQDRIIQVTVGGSNAWYMIGHSYWTPDFSKALLSHLEVEYNLPQTANLYWENIYMNHIDQLEMYVKHYDNNEILEFDNLKELCAFDSAYNKYRDTQKLCDLPYGL